ncbi:helix-turn-helix domain-containing protein [Thermococcus celer]|uniref:DNA-binding protein n=1 Tax=Thermococcus celer Vu 13 = JCM 8558 TaxID=1293037 RepID=A0A218P1K8_THECE|nr:helix-turn-helix domain-containing protein [Thermococcus celer]ASI98797.1 DNA-binding protein [Thermococcus celer Vu 13 = JCM 8558]
MLDKVLELVKAGKTIDEIARELSIPKAEAEGALKILESMGYVEKVELGSSPCESCPLRNFCPGSCYRFKGNAYTVTDFKLDKEKKG